MSGRVARISISTPKELLDDFDSFIERVGFDRSKAIQQAMNNFLTEYKWTQSKSKTVTGVVIFIYNHDIPGLDELLTEIQHHYSSIINSTLHLHLGQNNCLQIVAVKGFSSKIQKLSQEISTRRGVKQLKYAIVTP